MRSFLQDIRLAIRLLGSAPAMSILSIATLALGVALATVLFSILDAAFLRPLPYPRPEELVRIALEVRHGERIAYVAPSLDDLRDWREGSSVIEGVAAARLAFTEPLVLDGTVPRRIEARRITRDYLRIYGVEPFRGRAFTPQEHDSGNAPVVMLGHAFWISQFAGSPETVGQPIRLSGVPFTVVGILPPWFHGDIELWRPFDVFGDMRRRGTGAEVSARLRTGVSVERAERELNLLANRIAASRGGTPAQIRLTSLYDVVTRANRMTAKVITWAVALVLLLACANVTALLLAGGAARASELAIRGWLGAKPSRLVRQMATESLVMSAASGSLGAFFAWLCLDVLVANVPLTLPANTSAAIDWRALAFSAAAALFLGIACGLVPAFRASRISATAPLSRVMNRRATSSSKGWSRVLISAEVAIAFVLLLGAGLMMRSYDRLTAVDLGFDPGGVLAIETGPSVPSQTARAEYYPSLVERLASLPEVEAAGAVDFPPLSSGSMSASVAGRGAPVSAHVRQYLGEYFRALGVAPLEGVFPRQTSFASREAVINQAASKALFPDAIAIGRTFTIDEAPYTVSAVIADIRHDGPLNPVDPEIWTPFDPADDFGQTLYGIVRPRTGRDVSRSLLREVAQAGSSQVIVQQVTFLDEWRQDQVATPRRRTVLFALLGGFGSVLALVGVFGVTANAVLQRSPEIGIRAAVGASRGHILRMVLGDALAPVVAGLAAGLGVAWFAARLVEHFLFRTSPHDTLTFVGTAMALAAAATVAAWVPARRASAVDPATAIRAE